MKFWETWFFSYHIPKKVGLVTLKFSKFLIINANLWSIYGKRLKLWSTLLFERFEELNFSDFWGPVNLLGPSKKTQLLDSWPLSMSLKTRPWANLFKNIVLYLGNYITRGLCNEENLGLSQMLNSIRFTEIKPFIMQLKPCTHAFDKKNEPITFSWKIGQKKGLFSGDVMVATLILVLVQIDCTVFLWNP